MKISEIITVNYSGQNRELVFAGTPVPIESLFMHLKLGISLDEYLQEYPAVTREKATALLDAVNL